MLTVSNLTYRIAGRTIFDDATTVVQPGWKVGLVGPNGAGKSTLFKLVAGELQADGGAIQLNDKATIGWVRQDTPETDDSLLDIVLAADEERARLLREAEVETDPYKQGDMYARLDDIDAWAAPARAATILSGLGFSESDQQKKITEFSGGWRMRVALAAVLFQSPDFLLLDEPTNHLDLEAVMWLEAYLASYPKTLLMISHDRELLNTCVDHVIHVENKVLTSYQGNYDLFEKERAEKLMSRQKLHEKQQAKKAHMEAFVARFRAKASKAKQAQSRLKALEKMDVVDAVMAERSIKFIFPNPTELPPPLMTINHADIGYAANRPVLKRVHERLDMDDRIALLGANGNGKSTLIKLLAGKLKPLAGEINQSSKLKIGYFSQYQTDELDVDETPYQALNRLMQSLNKSTREADVRAKLGQFGFNKDLADSRIGTLSGGEKARLLFAFIAQQTPHLLLLDEPTNHLDMDAREALVQALNTYEGAVVIVSHDPSMIERVADRLWLVHDGAVQPYDGDLLTYRQLVLAQRRDEKKRGGTDKSGGETASAPHMDLKERKKLFPELAKAASEAEAALFKLQGKQKKLEDKLAADAKGGSAADQQAYGKLKNEIETAEQAWLAAQEAFDEAR